MDFQTIAIALTAVGPILLICFCLYALFVSFVSFNSDPDEDYAKRYGTRNGAQFVFCCSLISFTFGIVGMWTYKDSNDRLFVIYASIMPIGLVIGCILYCICCKFFDYDGYKDATTDNKIKGCFGMREKICPCCDETIWQLCRCCDPCEDFR